MVSGLTEQKYGAMCERGVGYNRFVGEQASQATDLILPSTVAVPSIADCASMKLKSKQREGKNVRCVYDSEKTPL
jgi:hypothetical protein